ncbi:MAG: uroporphyrinogen decarboxylase family protein [Saccharofermentanales bacterium]
MAVPDSKRRVLAALAREHMDRVPIDYSGNPGITGRLMKYYGVNDNESLLRALGVDIRGVGAAYTGPALHFSDKADVYVDPAWGFRSRRVEHASGSYYDPCDFPLKDATDEMLYSFPLPDPDDFDYDGVADQCRFYGEFGIHAGNSGMGCIMNKNGRLMTMEQSLMGIVSEDDTAYQDFTDRRLGIELKIMERTLEKTKGLVDFFFMGEDLGTQRAPMVSMDVYRNFIKPREAKFTALARSYNLPLMFHSCGSSSWVFSDLIEIGITAIDTLQPEAAGMSPQTIKDDFEGRLSFHGCISSALLSLGTVEKVLEHVREVLEIMMPTDSYLFSPSHMLQDNTPTDNAVEMYRYVKEHGFYS